MSGPMHVCFMSKISREALCSDSAPLDRFAEECLAASSNLLARNLATDQGVSAV